MLDGTSFLQDKRILIIEDREENRRLLHAILKLEGAQSLEATSGHEGIAMAAQERPDLILMDLNMPGLDGISATRMLRENPLLRSVPVIFVTASVGADMQRDVLAAGGDGVLTKPLDPMTLASQIAAILAHRAALDQTP